MPAISQKEYFEYFDAAQLLQMVKARGLRGMTFDAAGRLVPSQKNRFALAIYTLIELVKTLWDKKLQQTNQLATNKKLTCIAAKIAIMRTTHTKLPKTVVGSSPVYERRLARLYLRTLKAIQWWNNRLDHEKEHPNHFLEKVRRRLGRSLLGVKDLALKNLPQPAVPLPLLSPDRRIALEARSIQRSLVWGGRPSHTHLLTIQAKMGLFKSTHAARMAWPNRPKSSPADLFALEDYLEHLASITEKSIDGKWRFRDEAHKPYRTLSFQKYLAPVLDLIYKSSGNPETVMRFAEEMRILFISDTNTVLLSDLKTTLLNLFRMHVAQSQHPFIESEIKAWAERCIALVPKTEASKQKTPRQRFLDRLEKLFPEQEKLFKELASIR